MSANKNRLSSRFSRRLASINKNNLSPGIFSQELRRKSTQSQKLLFNKLDKLYKNPARKVSLYNSAFTQGTYRITRPGVYVLRENIVFNPNVLFPTAANYPTGQNGPYHLGFFAAITV